MLEYIQNFFYDSISSSNKSVNNENKNSSDYLPNKSSYKKLKKIQNILSSSNLTENKLNQIKSLCWSGLPFSHPEIRAKIWRMLLYKNYYNHNILLKKYREYRETVLIFDSILDDPKNRMNEKEYKIYKDITKDVLRTFPDYKIFNIDFIKKILIRVLYIWSMRNKEVSYIQGFNDLCCPFIIVFINEQLKNEKLEKILNLDNEELMDIDYDILMQIECDVYWCYTELMKKIQNDFNIDKLIINFNEMIKLNDIELYLHLKKNNIFFMQFLFRWVNCFLIREFSLKNIIRIWDSFFSEDSSYNNFILCICTSLLINFSEELRTIDNDQNLIKFLQNIPTNDWNIENIEILLAKSYQISTKLSNLLN